MNLAAIRSRRCIGEVVRHNSTTFVRNLEGRRTNVLSSNVKVHAGHHVGENCHYHGIPPPLPSYVRIVYIDVRKVRRCSVGSVPFHSSAWPTFDVRRAKPIARAIWTNHCGWASILVVRGRRLRPHNDYFRSSRVLDNLLWRWCVMGRPFVVCKEGNDKIGGGDPVPAWLNGGVHCVSDNFCQCNFVGVDVSGKPRIING